MGNRAVSVHQLLNQNFKVLEFDEEWLESFGEPELTGSWLIWGNSGNGKTRFALQLAKYLTTFGRKVAYNSMEEGASVSMRRAFAECGMQEVSRRIVLLDNESMVDLEERLSKRKSPDVVIIDSVQYSGMTYADYKRFRDKFRNKLFILISHAEGKHPEGRVARSIRFDAYIKIWVEGYRAFPMSRYGGGEPYVIWEEGAAEYVSPKQSSK
jgi:hypothetical protein